MPGKKSKGSAKQEAKTASPAAVPAKTQSKGSAKAEAKAGAKAEAKAVPKASGIQQVSEKVDFPAEEEKILSFWTRVNAFHEQLKRSEGKPAFNFYDGPPFATGLPHYGHLLAGTIKDTVTRFATMTGHYVERRFGWDCHGLPVEYEIDQKLGTKSKADVLALKIIDKESGEELKGIAAYNYECRSIVSRYAHEWESRVTRLGRWIDFKRDYRTMDRSFMESVWWVFSELFKKNLVYQGVKVMPYSTACTTSLSNFESHLNYKTVKDPAVVVSFPLENDPTTSLLAWTTTPWTLPSNLGLCVHPDFEYVKIKDKKTGAFYILGKARLSQLYPGKGQPQQGHVPHGENSDFLGGAVEAEAAAAAAQENAAEKQKGQKQQQQQKPQQQAAPKKGAAPKKEEDEADKPYEIIKTMTGAELKDLRYVPLFPYFAHLGKQRGAFRVLNDTYVTDDSGTGIVHQAPAFGEDDYRVCLNAGVITKEAESVVCPVDMKGHFTEEVTDFVGRHVKEADKDIQKYLKAKGRLVQQAQIDHSYPFCWRSDTPLIYKAVSSWFVKVEEIKDRLVANNAKTYWVPEFVKTKRFHNWLAEARDWAVSRNRYWGTPLPIWMSEDGKEVVCVSSIQELAKLSGLPEEKLTDIHRDKIDHITIPSKRGKQYGVLRRVDEVFDCWFESGSMPYGQQHYPFENKEKVEATFPADFIAEGLDQTRGWFYTLMVLSTALFDKPAFKNVVVNGLVLAEDGKKMSKRLKNYPDPMLVVGNYGADALRLYLINSPVVRAEPLRFKESGVFEVVKRVFLPWFHAYRFLAENIKRYETAEQSAFTYDREVHKKVTNVLDKWILSRLQSLISFVRQEMEAYRLYTVVPELLKYIDELTNWYVRTNRKRMRGQGTDTVNALQTLFEVLYSLTRLMAPFTPYLVEVMYQNLKHALPEEQRLESVHYQEIPTARQDLVDPKIEKAIARMQLVIEQGRVARENRSVSLKWPLNEVIVVHSDPAFVEDVESLKEYVRDELNVKKVTVSSKVAEFIALKATPNQRALGARLGKRLGEISALITALSSADIKKLQASGSVTLAGEEIKVADVEISQHFSGDREKFEAVSSEDLLVLQDVVLTPALVAEGMARDVVNRVQKLRKAAGLVSSDAVEVFYELKEKKKEEKAHAAAAPVDDKAAKRAEERAALRAKKLAEKSAPKKKDDKKKEEMKDEKNAEIKDAAPKQDQAKESSKKESKKEAAKQPEQGKKESQKQQSKKQEAPKEAKEAPKNEKQQQKGKDSKKEPPKEAAKEQPKGGKQEKQDKKGKQDKPEKEKEKETKDAAPAAAPQGEEGDDGKKSKREQRREERKQKDGGQKAGKAAGPAKQEKITVPLQQVLAEQAAFIAALLRRPLHPVSKKPVYAVPIIAEDAEVEGQIISLTVTRPVVLAGNLSDLKLTPAAEETVKGYLATKDHAVLSQQVLNNANYSVSVVVDGKDVTLQAGKHFLLKVE